MLLRIFHSVVVLEIARVFLAQVHKLESRLRLTSTPRYVSTATPWHGVTEVKTERPRDRDCGRAEQRNNHFTFHDKLRLCSAQLAIVLQSS